MKPGRYGHKDGMINPDEYYPLIENENFKIEEKMKQKRYKINYKTMWRNIKEYIMSEIIYMKNSKYKIFDEKIRAFEKIYYKMQEEELIRKETEY